MVGNVILLVILSRSKIPVITRSIFGKENDLDIKNTIITTLLVDRIELLRE